MEQISGESTVVDGADARERMRDRARARSQAERGPYLTPAWLDQSFVLPAGPRDGGEAEVVLPAPRAAILNHAPAPVFERPAAPEVDFATVVRRADAGRRARITTAAGLLLALVAVLVFQVSGEPAAAVCAVVAAVVTIAAASVRVVLGRAPVPYLGA
jgi:hypothetical protein